MKKQLVRIILLFLWSTTPQLFSQPNNQGAFHLIQGSVVDRRGNPLRFANIFIQGSFEGAMSDSSGRFQFTSSKTGSVVLTCSHIGYESKQLKIVLQSGKTIIIHFRLNPKAIQGQQVTVTASSFIAADEEGVTLSAMDVVRTPGAAADLFWAIKTLPGVQQVDEGAGLFVRGGDVSETVVLLDGAVINHPYKWESPTGGFFGTFNPFLLKGTFFSSGGFSVQYGNALSGALSMESNDLPDRRNMGFGIGLAAESIYLAVPLIDDTLGFSFSGNHSNTKMMFELNRNRKDFSHYPSSYDVNFNAVYKVNSHSQLKFFFFREDDNVGVAIDDPDYSSQYNGNSSNRLYNFKFSSLIQKKIVLQANLAFSIFRQGLHLSLMDLDTEDQLLQFRLMGEKELFGGVWLRTGLEFFKRQTLLAGTVFQDELDLRPNAPIDTIKTDYISNRTAHFIEFDIFGPFGFKITPGLRTEVESISKLWIMDPRVALVIPISFHSNINAAYGFYRQYPDPQYYDSYVGNPDLSAMKAVHAIIGYAYQKENFIFRMEGYHKDYKNLLLENPRQNYINGGNGFATGVDLFLKHSHGPVSGWVSYSWLEARRKWMDVPVSAPTHFDITNNLTTVLNLDLPKNFSLGFSYRYATGKPYTPASGKINEARVPYYQKVDMNVSYLYHFFESNTTVFYLGISNVLGRTNIFDYRYSADYKRRDAVESPFGHSIYFGISFSM
jgi:hypothetical protein